MRSSRRDRNFTADWLHEAGRQVRAGDSLYGMPADGPRRERAIPLADVRSASVRRFSLGRTAGLAGVVVGGFVVAGLIDCASSDKNFC